MRIIKDVKTLWKMAFSPSHREPDLWLNAFYEGQAPDYDHFRNKLLAGRKELYERIPAPQGGVWVDMGGGTGSNLEFVPRRKHLTKLYVVDLCDPLLNVARDRIASRNWKNVEAVRGDATSFIPPEGKADVVTFSYSLTMIPDWIKALDHARSLLKPGGILGVVDFYVSRKHAKGAQHGWLARRFWPAWFERDNVFLSPHHLDYLEHLGKEFEQVQQEEMRGRIPYLPGLRVPYYLFLAVNRA